MTSTRCERTIGVVVCTTLCCLVLAAIAVKVVQYYGFRIGDWDTGIYTNVVWNLFSGDGFYSDQNQRNQLGEHFSPIVIAFVPFFFISASPVWLLAGQGLAVGATYVLIYFIALKIFGDAKIGAAKPLALVFAVWASLYAPLTSALIFQFHPSTFVTPLVAAAILALLYRRDWLLWVCIGVLVLSKENATLAIMGLGLYAALVMARPWLGACLLGVGVVSAVLIMNILMPHFRTGTWQHYARLGPLSHWQQKAAYLFTLVKGLAFLPLASWRSLVCAVPLVALNLAVAYTPQFSMSYQYDDFASVFLLVAAMHGTVTGLALINSTLKGPHAAYAYVLGAAVALVLVVPATRSVVPAMRWFWPGEAERQLYRELAPYRNLPVDIGIAADNDLGPYVSARSRYVAMGAPPHRLDVSLDITRLKPGDQVLFTPIRGKVSEKQRALDGTPGLVRVHTSPVLYVYEVVDPSSGPQPGTRSNP